MPRRAARRTAALAALTLALLPACRQPQAELEPFQAEVEKDYGRPLPPGQLALRKIPPSRYPDFSRGFYRRSGLAEAVRHSLDYLAKRSSQRYYPYGEITHAQVVRSLERFLELLETSLDPDEFNAAIRREFDVYQSVGYDDRGTVFYTGYYTPIFDGRRIRGGAYQHPLYALPPDLVKNAEGQTLGRRQADGTVAPGYPTRREIEQGGLLRGHEIAWLKDPFEAYVVTVQGSAKLRLPDGSLMELGYAGNNGHEYSPIVHGMVADGVISRDDISLQSMLAYFRAHPEDVPKYTYRNDRYVFFAETPGGPRGSLNTPVTPYHTIATDKSVFPRAAVAYVVTDLPRRSGAGTVRNMPYAGFALDQDTGGGIRAAGRCDVYMGVGERAEALAGRTGSEGGLYYIFLKSSDNPQAQKNP